MSDINIQQALLSENLLLLKELGYVYPELKSPPFHKTIQIELELLDTIASVLSTGCGDAFAAAFDKGHGFIELILAKSDKRTIADEEFASSFLAHIIDPNVKNATDIFPFLLKHRRACLNMRMKKLHAISIDTKFNQYFHSLLDHYVAECKDPSLEVQFPRRHSIFDKDKDYHTLLKEYLIQTQSYSEEDLDESALAAWDTFFNLYIFSETLTGSAFMQELKSYSVQSNLGRKARKFIRHAEKIGHYTRGVTCLLQYAKRLFRSRLVIPHRWIEDTFTGTGEGRIQFQANNAYDVACRIRGTNPLPAKHSDNLDNAYPSNREPWQPLFASLHPEIRIILSSLEPKEQRGEISRAIGLSKQPCVGCMFWIKYYNRGMSTRWVMNGFCGKPDPTFALPGEADPVNSYPTDNFSCEGNFVDPYVERDVYMKLVNQLQWFLKRGSRY
jgi:hypothetical protein